MLSKKKPRQRYLYLAIFITYFILGIFYFFHAFKNNLLIAPGDSWIYYYPLRLYLSSFAKYGFSLWLPYEFAGTSFLGVFQSSMLYPPNLIFLLVPARYSFNISLIAHYALGAFFTFLYVRLLGVKKLPAFLAGLVFGFSGFLMAHKGHVSIQNAAIWLPLLLYLYEKIRTKLKWQFAVLAGLIVAIQIFAGHLQVPLYTYMLLALFVLFYLPRIDPANRKLFLLLCALPLIIGGIIASPQLIATKELSNYALRVKEGYEFFTDYSFPPFMFPILAYPFLFGGGYGIAHWWGAWNLTEMAGFTGILPLALAFLAFLKQRKENFHAKFWGLVCVLAFLLALGKYNPLYKITYYIPIYNLFRVPARHWLEFDFAVAVLFALGLNQLIDVSKEKKGLIKKAAIAVTAVGLSGLVFAWMGRSFLASSFTTDILSPQGHAIFAQAFGLRNLTFIIPLLFTLAYLIWLYCFYKLSLHRGALLTAVAILVFAEAFSFGAFHDSSNWPKLSSLDEDSQSREITYLKGKVGYERIAYINKDIKSLSFVPERINSLNGYDPLILNDFHNLLDMESSGISGNWKGLVENNLILSTLGVRYIILQNIPLSETDIANIKGTVVNSTASFKTTAPLVPLKHWDYINARIKKDNYSLKSPDGDELSIIQQQLSLKPFTYYLLSFEAEAKEKPSSKLTLDLYGGPDYDPPEQEIMLESNQLTKRFQTYTKMISTGAIIPSQVSIRAFTLSRNPIVIKDIQVRELGDYKNRVPLLSKAKPSKIDGKGIPMYTKVFSASNVLVFKNRNCLPRVFSVSNIKPADSLGEVKKQFYLFEFNPRKTALTDKKAISKIGQTRFKPGKVKIKKYEPDQVTIDAEFAGKGFVILSDQYYPGWKAFIDNKETPIYQTNGILRGIVIPPGHHMILFKYAPTNIYAAAVVSSIVFIACLITLLISSLRKKLIPKRGKSQISQMR